MSETKQASHDAVAGPVEPTVRQHTPGPWDWWMAGNGHAMPATPDRGRLYVMQPVRCGMQGGTVRFADWGKEPRGRRGGVMRPAYEFCRDNVLMHPDALLIAAAPDLLEALQAITTDRGTWNCMPMHLRDLAGAALAKAVGSAA